MKTLSLFVFVFAFGTLSFAQEKTEAPPHVTVAEVALHLTQEPTVQKAQARAIPESKNEVLQKKSEQKKVK